MKKEEILEASRQEHKNTDFVEMEAARYAGSVAASVGAFVCGAVSLMGSVIAGIMLYSPWTIYFSMMGASWLVRAIKLKRLSNYVLAAVFLILAVMAFAGLWKRLAEGML